MSPRIMPVESVSNENEENYVTKEDVPKEEPGQEDVNQNNDDSKPKTKQHENWPLRDIKEPHENDVLYGRGGGTNHHPGNKRYRKLVEERKMDYVTSKRLDKPLVALHIIRTWREQDPPGRFLKLDEKTGLWSDVGDKKAREKTSQALREKAPLLRQQHEGEDSDEGGSDEECDKSKTTRFDEGTNQNGNNAKKPVLARDHSLGREYIEPGAEVTLVGFSWQDPLEQVYPGRAGSQGSLPPGPPQYYPPGRMNSQGSIGVAHPNYHQSHGSYSYEYPDYEYRERSEGPHAQYISTGRYESWGQPISSMGSNGPPMPPPPMQYGAYPSQMNSGSWGSMVSGPMGSGSWGPHGPNMGREHSLSTNPLRNATTSQPAAGFDSHGGSGYWPDVPPQQAYGRAPSETSPPYGYPPPESYRTTSNSPPSLNRSPPRGAQAYTVDPTIARTWSSQSDAQSEDYDRVVNMIKPPHVPGTWSGDDGDRKKAAHAIGPPLRHHEGDKRQLARPQIVKRATSNQNETVETKPDLKGPSVKRAALNRDNSLASNRLKAAYLRDTMNKNIFDSERELRLLPGTLERQASLKDNTTRPKWLSPDDRLSTIDKIAMELMMQPEPFELGNKRRSSTTLEALLDFDCDPLLVRPDFDRQSSASNSGEMREEAIARPPPLNADARLTTMDFLDICSEVDDDDRLQARPLDLNREVSVSEWLNEDV